MVDSNCFSFISRWFKKRRKSIDFNSCPASLCNKSKEEKNNNLNNKFSTFSTLNEESCDKISKLPLNRNGILSMSPSSPTSLCPPGGRRPSILVTDPKTRSTQINYYKKRVSFGDILFQREFDVEGGFGGDSDEEPNDHDDHDDDHHEDDIGNKIRDLTTTQNNTFCSNTSFPLKMPTNGVLVS